VKIGLVIYDGLESVSGGYLYDRQLVSYLRAQGDEVEIFSLPGRDYPRHLKDNFTASTREIFQRSDIEVWIQDELSHPSLLAVNRELQATGVPLIALVHHLRSCEPHPWGLRLFYRFVERLYLRQMTGCIYNSKATRRAVSRAAGRRIQGPIAYPGRDADGAKVMPDEIAARAQVNCPLRMIFLGNLIPRKGVADLIEAMGSIPPWMELNLVGSMDLDPGYVAFLKKLAEREEVEDMIFFRGRLDGRALTYHLRRSQLLVMPSYYEGFGLAYLEGMGWGLPAIGTTAGGADELIKPGDNGYLIMPGDIDRLGGYILSLALEREFLVELSLGACKSYAKHPTWEESFRKVRKFLARV